MRKLMFPMIRYVLFYLAMVPGVAALTMFLLRLSGLSGYSHRSGPGIYDGIQMGGFFYELAPEEGSTITKFSDALREAGYLFDWFSITVPAALLVAIFLFFLVHMLRMIKASQRSITIISAVSSTLLSSYLIFAFGWYILMDYAVLLVVVITGYVFGALLLPRHQAQEFVSLNSISGKSSKKRK